jgi:replicative DNA helicase
MRVNKITPTDNYKEIEFRQIKDKWEDSRVLTSTGFDRVYAFDYIKTGPSVRIIIDDDHTLICDPGHIVLTNHGPSFAKDLTGNNECLIGYNGEFKTFTVLHDCQEEDFYDIEISDPHWYYTESILSHNSLMMVNNAFSALKQGHDVMFVTYELSALKTAMRLASSMSDINMDDFVSTNVEDISDAELNKLRDVQARVRRKVKNRYKGAELVIYEMPPDECSVDNIYAIIDSNYKMKGWRPKVVILDYLELMLSRRSSSNDDDYTRQKSVATEVRGLAKNEEVFVISGTQTNRSGLDQRGRDNDDGRRILPNINLDKSAESFGKTMPVDYVVSMNQTEDEYQREPSVIRLWVAKNRNGPKFVSVTTNVWYNRMFLTEIS